MQGPSMFLAFSHAEPLSGEGESSGLESTVGFSIFVGNGVCICSSLFCR